MIEERWLMKVECMTAEELSEEAEKLAEEYAYSEALRSPLVMIGFTGSIPFACLCSIIGMLIIPPNMAPILSILLFVEVLGWMFFWDIVYRIHERKVKKRWKAGNYEVAPEIRKEIR